MGFGESFRNVVKNLSSLNKSYSETTVRPSISSPYMSTDTGAKLPIFPFPLIMIYELADNIDALRIPIETINREMFKNGFEVVEKWKYKCKQCEKEFKFIPETADEHDVTCDSCGSKDLRRPEPKNRQVLQKLIDKPINGNSQTIEDLSRQLERDLEIADNAYMLILKNYFIDDSTGKIDHGKTEIKEFLRIDPPQIGMIADSDGRIGFDDKRNKVWVCPRFEHRDKRLLEEKCDRCGAEGLKAICEVNSVYSVGIPQPKRVIYGEGEIIYKACKYKPSLVYGYSPIYAVWSKAMSLTHMDEYIRKYFDKMRPPRGLLLIGSRNYETFRKSWDALEQKAMEDPYMIHPLLVETERSGKSMAQWIDFTGSLRELEFIEVRKELRQIIGAIYGVLPLYYGEMVGGWSQEGLQVTITNRAVKWGQDILHRGFLTKVCDLLGVDDWDLRLVAGEENDKLRDLQTKGTEIENAMKLQQMGFDVSRSHTGDFKISKDPINYQNPNKPEGKPPLANPVEERSSFEGEPKHNRPSDVGGLMEGHPASGSGTSLSQKNYPDGITPANFEIVKKTLQSALDFGWKKTKTVDELRKYSGMTVRHARELVKHEFAQMRGWENAEED